MRPLQCSRSTSPGNGLAFCCQGCEGAYALIHGWGLDDYYALRDRLGSGPQRAVSQASQAVELLEDLAAAGVHVHDAGNGLSCVTLAVDGLHCGACAWLIERCPPLVPGWHAAQVRMSDHTVRLIYDPQATAPKFLARVLASLGYQLAPMSASGEAADARFQLQNRKHLIQIAIAGFCAMNAMWIAVALYAGEASGIAREHEQILRWVGSLLGIGATLGPGSTFFRGAWGALRTRTPHMDIPLALGLAAGTFGSVVGAWRGVGDIYFDSLAVLVFLLLCGRWIQFRQQRRAGQSVSLLMRLTPAIARRQQPDGTLQTVPAERLVTGDVIEVRAGDAIAADGEVIQGESLLNRALLTGESEPVAVNVHDAVAAGTINLTQPIRIRVSAVGSESRIGRLMQVVEEAAGRQTPIVQLADRASGRFIKLILLLAAVTLWIWWDTGSGVAVGHTIALLIVACPCALALATPLSIAVALGRAARRKILIRSGDVFERMARPGMIWLDKTGTLTTGQLQLVASNADNATLALIASVEQQSNHPIAETLVRAAKAKGISVSKASEIEQTTGGGIRGRVAETVVCVGTEAYLAQQNVTRITEHRALARDAIARGRTPVFYSIDGECRGVLAVADSVRHDAQATIQKLRKQGWRLGILSGDHPDIVQRVAREVGIEDSQCHGGLSPEEKVKRVDQSRGEGTVVMVGDGVNDAAALAAADVGIATRGGAEVSLQAAPVFLAQEGLAGLASLSDAARRTLRGIRRGFTVSLAYNLFAVSLAVFGKINPLLAAVLMPLSSLTVVSLALLTKTFEAPSPTGGD